jgi:hypothetical protein
MPQITEKDRAGAEVRGFPFDLPMEISYLIADVDNQFAGNHSWLAFFRLPEQIGHVTSHYTMYFVPLRRRGWLLRSAIRDFLNLGS